MARFITLVESYTCREISRSEQIDIEDKQFFCYAAKAINIKCANVQNECCLCPDLPKVVFFCKCVLLAACFWAHSVACPPLCIYVINHSLFCLETFKKEKKKKNWVWLALGMFSKQKFGWVISLFWLALVYSLENKWEGELTDDSYEKQKSWIQAPIYSSRKEAYEHLEGNFSADLVFSSP